VRSVPYHGYPSESNLPHDEANRKWYSASASKLRNYLYAANDMVHITSDVVSAGPGRRLAQSRAIRGHFEVRLWCQESCHPGDTMVRRGKREASE
jgi:hypothetical protein